MGPRKYPKGTAIYNYACVVREPMVFRFLPTRETPVSRPLPDPGSKKQNDHMVVLFYALLLRSSAWGRDRTGDLPLFRTIVDYIIIRPPIGDEDGRRFA